MALRLAPPASDKQRNFIVRLLNEREHTYNVETVKATVDTLLVTEASRLIGELLKCPPKVASPATSLATMPSGQVEDGMYLEPGTLEVFKVQYNKASGDGRRPYAKRLVIREMPEIDEDGALLKPAKISFNYEPGLLREIKPEWKMTLEQAEQFGTLYGVCCRCGRTLTDETSIELGIGPVCRAAFA